MADWINLLRDIGVFAIAAWMIRILVQRSLDRSMHEHRIRFGALHENRVHAMSRSYALLVLAENALVYASDVAPAQDEARQRMDAFGRAANRFFLQFSKVRIWFSEDTCARFDELWSALKAAGYAAVDERSGRPRLSTETCRDVLESRVKPLRAQIEREFRQLLGVQGRA